MKHSHDKNMQRFFAAINAALPHLSNNASHIGNGLILAPKTPIVTGRRQEPEFVPSSPSAIGNKEMYETVLCQQALVSFHLALHEQAVSS
jgi:hypothetical protein